MKLDERTLVPLGPVLFCMGAVLSIAVSGAFWIKSVDDRLSMIETKLGIMHGDSSEAHAAEILPRKAH